MVTAAKKRRFAVGSLSQTRQQLQIRRLTALAANGLDRARFAFRKGMRLIHKARLPRATHAHNLSPTRD